MEELICKCALNRIFNYKPKAAHTLLKAYKTASNIFQTNTTELENTLKQNKNYAYKINKKTLKEEANEVKQLLDEGYQIIQINSSEYPEILAQCPDAPIVLYVKSITPAKKLFNQDNSFSVVGTRNMTSYGCYWTKNIIKNLYNQYSYLNYPLPTIVSGLAYGVDIEAHKTALELGMPTIAVMATGINKVYPYKHIHIANKIATTPGSALITDYPINTSPKGYNFLKRNRIIAGLSRATIITESRIKGGAMMTSRTAFSYNRDVYALPGRIDDEFSSGCNELIAREIAQPISNIDCFIKNIASECNLLLDANDTSCSNEPKLRDKIEVIMKNKNSKKELDIMKKIADIIEKHTGISLLELSYRSQLEYRYTAIYTQILASEGLITIDFLQRCSVNPLFKF